MTVQKTTLTILERLNRVISVESQAANSNDRVQISDLQSLLCATLQVRFSYIQCRIFSLASF